MKSSLLFSAVTLGAAGAASAATFNGFPAQMTCWTAENQRTTFSRSQLQDAVVNDDRVLIDKSVGNASTGARCHGLTGPLFTTNENWPTLQFVYIASTDTYTLCRGLGADVGEWSGLSSPCDEA
ncbi:hypothetical protein F5X68DRAFT_243680 [Plectosphaerella plurivora]|uniref:Uncharacterized protein n=1 Tax=Plectosphaerella plurivora TaxID=936078 RepID=A0A9P8VJP1_9PEZI|nr:hypothetical protein F5X68DRAFT_243680 [Plectosphaerella plurivora]